MSIVERTSTRSVRRHCHHHVPSSEVRLANSPADRLEHMLVCPCGGALVDHVVRGSSEPAHECGHVVRGSSDLAHERTTEPEVQYTCDECGLAGRRVGSQYVFGGFAASEVKGDWLNRLKELAKRKLGRFYRQAIDLVSPMYAPPLIKPWLTTFDAKRDLVADLGCGPIVYSQDVLCVDGVNYPNVHLVADLARLPIKDDSLAGVISFGVLEHVPDPQSHVAEFRRVLRPGGRVFCFIPFIQGFHASPYDYQRYTAPGMRELFRDFEVLDVRVASGPTSGMLWVLQEWLAMLFSFGSMRLYRLLMPVMWFLSPLKFLDILLSRHPAAGVICSGFVIEARKRK